MGLRNKRSLTRQELHAAQDAKEQIDDYSKNPSKTLHYF